MKWLQDPGSGAPAKDYIAYEQQKGARATCASNKEGFFTKWQEKIEATISDDFLNDFHKLTTDEDRIVFAWSLKDMHSMKVQKFYKEKNDLMSADLRSKGNKFFQDKDNKQALITYSQAVMLAPHGKGDVLSMAYANRSAVLYHTGDYDSCLADIQLALEAGYPKKLQFKVLDRRGQCLVKLNQLKSALEAFTTALQALEDADLDAKKLDLWKADLEKKINSCEGKDDKVTNSRGSSSSYPFFDGANSVLPNASDAVELTSSKSMGRYIRARRNIPAGKVVVAERPLGQVLNPDRTGSHCGTCFTQLEVPVPCPTCCNTFFCSSGCRDEGLASYHKWECTFADYLSGAGISQNTTLAFRMITQRGPTYFKEIKQRLQEAPPTISKEKPYNANDLLSAWSLVGLEELRSTADLFQRTLMACFLLKVLQKGEFFGKSDFMNESEAGEELRDDELRVASCLLRIICVLQFNVHEMSGLASIDETNKALSASNKTMSATKAVFYPLGTGIYPTICFMNHSCYPTVTRFFDGTKMVLVTIRPIQAGEMVAENYGPRFTRDFLYDRQKKLEIRYWFKCSCIACTENWPHYDQMPEGKTLLCPKCRSKLPMATPSNPNVTCTNCSTEANCIMLLKEVKQNENIFMMGKRFMAESNAENAIKAFETFINAAIVLVAPPYKELHLAMDSIRMLIPQRGNKPKPILGMSLLK